jgi:uncharacterized protein with PQ loop repeat
MTAFLTAGWITMMLAILATFDRRNQRTQDLETKVTSSTPPDPLNAQVSPAPKLFSRIFGAARKLLDTLADLQAITGIGILVSGLAQANTITFYHQELVSSYWLLTINSFWAIRPEYMSDDNDHEKDYIMLQMRRITIFASTGLGLGFQAWITLREVRAWDKNSTGFCYIYSDPSYNSSASSWFWWSGLLTYAVALFLVICGQRRILDDCIRGRLEDWLESWWSSLRTRYKKMVNLIDVLKLFYCAVFFSVYWIFVQFISIWSYGGSDNTLSSAFYILAYVGFNLWNTYDILTMKLLNKELLRSDEDKWGYGQVLPMIMLLQLVFNAVDIWRQQEKKPRSSSVEVSKQTL